MTPDPGKKLSMVKTIIAAGGMDATAAKVRRSFLLVVLVDARAIKIIAAIASRGNGKSLRNRSAFLFAG